MPRNLLSVSRFGAVDSAIDLPPDSTERSQNPANSAGLGFLRRREGLEPLEPPAQHNACMGAESTCDRAGNEQPGSCRCDCGNAAADRCRKNARSAEMGFPPLKQ